MHFLARLFPDSESGENAVAVKMFRRMSAVKEFFSKKNPQNWPVVSGNYTVVNSNARIAVCTLTSTNLDEQVIRWDNVAIVGKVFTPNLGIEKIIRNTISNPNIRYLLLCGKDSPVFHVGQAIQCLFKYGVDSEKRIKNAVGHFPVLQNLSIDNINSFLRQIELIDCIQQSPEIIESRIQLLDLNKLKNVSFIQSNVNSDTNDEDEFVPIKPGGKRIPLDYDKNGFFVIECDNEKREIIVKHYHNDNKPGYIIKGHSSESMLLAVLNKELVSQMSHAGYLGGELAKAETALKLNLIYVQDQPLKKRKDA